MPLFSLPPGVEGWLRLLLVALPGLFCLTSCGANFLSFSEHISLTKINNNYFKEISEFPKIF